MTQWVLGCRAPKAPTRTTYRAAEGFVSRKVCVSHRDESPPAATIAVNESPLGTRRAHSFPDARLIAPDIKPPRETLPFRVPSIARSLVSPCARLLIAVYQSPRTHSWEDGGESPPRYDFNRDTSSSTAPSEARKATGSRVDGDPPHATISSARYLRHGCSFFVARTNT